MSDLPSPAIEESLTILERLRRGAAMLTGGGSAAEGGAQNFLGQDFQPPTEPPAGVTPLPVVPLALSVPASPCRKEGLPQLAKISYSHDAIIDMILADPMIQQGDIARLTGYSQSWLSVMMASGNFKARLAERRGQAGIDEDILTSFKLRLEGLAMQSVEIVANDLSRTKDPKTALKVLGLTSKSLGYGAGQGGAGGKPALIQNNYVVALPGPAGNSQDWAEKFQGAVLEAQAKAQAGLAVWEAAEAAGEAEVPPDAT